MERNAGKIREMEEGKRMKRNERKMRQGDTENESEKKLRKDERKGYRRE